VLAAAGLLFGGIIWSHWRLEERLSALESQVAQRDDASGGPSAQDERAATGVVSRAGVAARSTAPAASAGERTREGVLVGRQLSYDSFRRVWRGQYASAAEAQCWGKYRADGGEAARPPVHFYVTVAADGAVTNVKHDARSLIGVEVPEGFADCLAGIIRTMRFPAPGAQHRARVQVDPPGSAQAAAASPLRRAPRER